MNNFFTFKGTLGRLDYFIKLVVLFIVSFLVTLVLTFILGLLSSLGIPYVDAFLPPIAIFLIFGAYTVSYLSITARRLHDLALSGWWQVIPLLLPFTILFYVWLSLSPMLGQLGIVATDPMTYQNFSFDRITSEQQAAVMATIQKASMINMVISILSLIFYLCLLFWPSRQMNNKYAFDNDSFSHDPKQFSPKKEIHYFVRLKEPIHEDSVYVIPHIKSELVGVKKINMPNDRSNMTFIVSNPNLKPKHIRKLLHKNGFFTSSIKKILS